MRKRGAVGGCAVAGPEKFAEGLCATKCDQLRRSHQCMFKGQALGWSLWVGAGDGALAAYTECRELQFIHQRM